MNGARRLWTPLVAGLLFTGMLQSLAADGVPVRGKGILPRRRPKPEIAAPARNPDWGVYHGEGRSTNGAVRLLRAREARQEDTGLGEVSYLEGDVKMIQDSLTIWCDEARNRQQQHILELTGDVLMVDPEKRLRADKVIYYSDMRRSIARGNVEVTRDSTVLTSRQGQYDETGNLATFDRNVVLHDLRRNVTLTGKIGTYDTKREIGRVPIDPVLTRFDSTGAVDAKITGLQMEYDSDKGFATVRDSVHIHWHDVEGHSDLLKYYPDLHKALLVGSPRVIRERDQAEGDSIWLYVTQGALDSAVIKGHALALTPSDSLPGSPLSTLEGQRIVMDFNDGVVRRMQSDGQAIGVYYLFEKGKSKGANKVSGDRVTLLMGDGELKHVIVVGGTQGKFLPPRLAKELDRGK